MEKTIYYFNPENDMALANFTPYYKAPAEIVRMADELAALPAWYAPEGSVVKVKREADIPCWERLCKGETPFPQVGWTTRWLSSVYVPWGWSPALVHTLLQAGVGSGFLPSGGALGEWRRLSGRVCASEVLRSFADEKGVCGESRVCRTLEEVRKAWDGWGRCVLKAPWSGSGRGLVFLPCGVWPASAEGWAARILRTQGALMAEPIYDKVCDFAMEFCAGGEGKVSFAGYSLFETDAFGNYKGNLLASDAEIERRLVGYVPLETLHDVRRHLLRKLPEWLGGHYTGYLGVDMMICREEGYRVHPCVEINLRMNMGVLARLFFDRYVHPAAQGCFRIEHYAGSEEALRFHETISQAYPVRLKDGRLAGGYLSLTPVCGNTRYQAYVCIGM
ncbi:hypothetical protein [uncultured Phocaeicola sp.]|uniref:hypothetical protein n=1 Tax=uncultured Phocaeicola sp. TaxID=990718 RepID=UPI0015B2F640|nr:hypothetical protein [uncultured Phocaeicola sp.]